MTATPQGTRHRLLRASVAMVAPYRRRALLSLAILLAALATTLAGPSLVEYAINHGLVHHRSMRVVDVVGACYLAVAAASYLLTGAQTRLLSSTGELVLNDLRKRVFSHLLSQPLSFYETESSGQLLTRMTADIDVLETLVQSGLGTLAMSTGLFVFSVAVLVATSPLLFAATAICLVPVVLASARYRTSSTRAYTEVRRRIGDTLSAFEEGLAGVRVVQAFRQEARVTAEFDERNGAQLDSEMATVRLAARFFPKVEGTGVITTVVVLLAGALLVHLRMTSIGAVAAFVLYVANLFGSIQSLSQLFDLLQSSGAALGTVFGLLEVEPAMGEPKEPAPLPRQGALELEGVGFSYSRSAGLRDVDLRIEPGEHLALVGPTGAGKSTIAKLIGRLYDPHEGTVRFGGVDLRRTSLAHLRQRIVVVPQEGFLFRGTVLDNILLGRPEAGEREVHAALARLGIAAALSRLPEGLATDVGERGAHLSAGERQLVSLARAALADPAVLVMDEATSSVDPGTERAVEAALAALGVGRTTVTVAHRLSSAERADRVAVVDGGRVVEVGAHSELVTSGGYYARLFAAWQGEDGATLTR